MKSLLQILIVVMVCFASCQVEARVDERRFAYQKQLQMPAFEVGDLGIFLLDNDMYASTDELYANMRLVDQNGAEIPFLLRQSLHDVTEVVESVVSSSIIERQMDVWTFGSDRQPLISLNIATPSRNFSRRAVVEGAPVGDDPKWVRLCDTTIQSFDLANHTERRLALPLNREARYDQYRLTVYNQDNASIYIEGVVATAHAYEVMFLADPQARYTVLYGGEGIRRPKYDIDSVLKSVRSPRTSLYTLGEEEPNPAYKPGLKRSGGVSGKVLFIVAMVVMVALLVWLIAKGAGKVEALNSENDQ